MALALLGGCANVPELDEGMEDWVKTADYWDVYFAMQETIKKRFDAEGISIPYPQKDVHLFQ